MSDFVDSAFKKLLAWCSYAIITALVFLLNSDKCNNGEGVGFFAALIMWIVLVAVVYLGHPLYADAVGGALVFYFKDLIQENGNTQPDGFLKAVGIFFGYLIAFGIIYYIILSVIRSKKAERAEADDRISRARSAGVECCTKCGCTSIYYDPLGIPHEYEDGTVLRTRYTHECTHCGRRW